MAKRDLKKRAYDASFLSDTEFNAEILRMASIIVYRQPYCGRLLLAPRDGEVSDLIISGPG